MSNIVKAIGIVIIIIGFWFFVMTVTAYDEAVEKMGVNVLTSTVGQQIFEYWIGEWVVIIIGIGILALGVKLGRRSSSD